MYATSLFESFSSSCTQTSQPTAYGSFGKMNFSEVPADTCFGVVQTNNDARLHAFNDYEEEVGESLFHINNKKIKLTKPMMPAMLTLDETVIRQDCLCYLMERLPHPDQT